MSSGAVNPTPDGGRRRAILLLYAVPVCLLLLLAGSLLLASYLNTITPDGIVIHHSAVPTPPDGRPVDAALLDEIHRRSGFGVLCGGRFYHVGYHYIILGDGTVQAGRPERCRGAHAKGYNSYVGICLVGNFSNGGGTPDRYGPREPTREQMRALAELTTRLRERHQIPLGRVVRHRDLNPDTQCPGERFPFPQLLEMLQQSELSRQSRLRSPGRFTGAPR